MDWDDRYGESGGFHLEVPGVTRIGDDSGTFAFSPRSEEARGLLELLSPFVQSRLVVKKVSVAFRQVKMHSGNTTVGTNDDGDLLCRIGDTYIEEVRGLVPPDDDLGVDVEEDLEGE